MKRMDGQLLVSGELYENAFILHIDFRGQAGLGWLVRCESTSSSTCSFVILVVVIPQPSHVAMATSPRLNGDDNG
jgi:hypothetical protein